MLDALVYAHGNGVVHRDIKPENIFLSGTNAVLADFGVAKAVSGPRRSAAVTLPGTTVGTPAYMAPEQIAGDPNADQRADLYSVGVVAYEMLAGRLPWEGSTPSEMLTSRATRTIAPLQSLRGDVPAELAGAIARCLAWNADKRPGSAEEVLRVVESVSITPTTPTAAAARLLRRPFRLSSRAATIGTALVLLAVAAFVAKWATSGPSTRRVVRLAVLYPEFASDARPDSALGEQLYHGLVSSLSPVSGLQLGDQIGVARMTASGMRPAQIADTLRADGVDSALVMQVTPETGGSYLLSVELLHLQRARRETMAGPVPLRSLDRLPPDSLRSLVRLLAGQVASRLALTSANRDVPETQMIDAWIAWSKGRDAYARRTPEGMHEAIGYFERAIRRDTLYAQAHADLAQALALSLFYRYRTSDQPYELASRALRLANRAIALGPTLAEGYTARGYIGVVAGAPTDFVRESYVQAQKLFPENPGSRTWYVGLLALQDKYDEALDTLQELMRLDPRSPGTRIAVALYSLPAGHYLSAVRNAVEARALEPGIPLAGALELWGRVLLGGGQLDQCLNVDAGPYLGARASCLVRTRGKAAASAITDSLFALVTGKARVDSTFDVSLYVSEMAMYYAAQREWDAARQWLRQAFHESPLGIEHRFLRAGLFSAELVALGDSLRRDAWRRVQSGAAGRGDDSTRPQGQSATTRAPNRTGRMLVSLTNDRSPESR